MFFGMIECIKGSYTLKATGRFPERLLNIASTSGIFVYDVVRKNENSIVFSVSRKGCSALLEKQFEGLEVSVIKKSGLPVFFERYKKRFILILLPALFFTASIVSSLFVWRVNISGGDEALRVNVREVLSKNGVYPGALKHKIDHYDVKRSSILEINDLAWLWVDVKGTSANVKIQKRTQKPTILEITEPADVISTHSGVIEKMQVYCGVPLLSQGMTVEKGQVIVTGVLSSENENIPTYYHHARADITLSLNKEKTFVIPKKTIKKVPTGNKKTVYGINFKKNNVKFSLNSGISYTNYDKIEKTVKLPLLPVSVFKTTYLEANIKEEETNIDFQIEKHRDAFCKELEKQSIQLQSITDEKEETPTHIRITFKAHCLVRADKEIPIEINQ